MASTRGHVTCVVHRRELGSPAGRPVAAAGLPDAPEPPPPLPAPVQPLRAAVTATAAVITATAALPGRRCRKALAPTPTSPAISWLAQMAPFSIRSRRCQVPRLP